MHSTAELYIIMESNRDTEENKKRKKEKTIDQLIGRIKFQGDRLQSGQQTFNISVICIGLLGAISLPFFMYNKTHTLDLSFWSMLLVSAVVSYAVSIVLRDYLKRYLNYSNLLKQLLVEVCEQPYEVRVELVKDGEKAMRNKKAKVIIEENLLISGSHVIKEKSKHISAYLDLTQPSESLIAMMATLAKKAESQFK